jgi:hypothetical protein
MEENFCKDNLFLLIKQKGVQKMNPVLILNVLAIVYGSGVPTHHHPRVLI